MFNHLRLSYSLLRLANSVLDRRKEKFKKELEILKLSERELNDTLDCLVGIKDHLVRKMCVHWLKKNSIILPEDLPKVEMAHKLAKDNRGIDYFKFDSPVEIIDKFEEKAQIEFDKLIKPDSMKELYNKVDLGEGVTVYTVENTKAGQHAVRRLADSHFGERFDNWCIIYRLRDKKDVDRDDMGMMVKSYETYWNNYNAYPKRIAFKDGRLIAFCANEYRAILWWDQNDKQFGYIPKFKHLGDDDEFINEYIVKGLIEDWKSGKISKEDLAKSRHLPSDILLELSNDEDYYVQRNVARNLNAPADALVKLSSNEDWRIRDSVAENPNTPSEALRKLSEDEVDSLRQTVAFNPRTPADILVKLSEDEYVWVRNYVALNPNTPVDVLVRLSDDRSDIVRLSVAINPNTSVDALVNLSDDRNDDVMGYAKANLKNRGIDV